MRAGISPFSYNAVNNLRHSLLATGLAYTVAVIIAVSIVLAGFAMPLASVRAEAPAAVSTQMAVVTAVKHCGDQEKTNPGSHQSHLACGSGINCLVFIAADSHIYLSPRVQLAFTVRATAQLAARSIIPPSPPPKTVIVV